MHRHTLNLILFIFQSICIFQSLRVFKKPISISSLNNKRKIAMSQFVGPSVVNLKGFEKFKRVNPMSDKFDVKYFHHVEFYCGDATVTHKRFMLCLGLELISKSDQSTSNALHASYVLKSKDLTMVFTAPYPKLVQQSFILPSSGLPVNSHTEKELMSECLPSFNRENAIHFFNLHGFGAHAVAIEVGDVNAAYQVLMENGAESVLEPMQVVDKNGLGRIDISEIKLYGDVVMRILNTQNFTGKFLPNFVDNEMLASKSSHEIGRYGIERYDHIVGNLWSLEATVSKLKQMTGFHDFAEFVAEDVGTVDSGLNSIVLASNNERVLLPLNEPTFGTKRKSQIQTYLEQNNGEGVQHLALFTSDIFKTLKLMREASEFGGFEFMASPGAGYYQRLRDRVGDAISEDQYRLAEEYAVLVDRDDQGVLLQIFTKPVGDRPTIFFEIIQRVGCMDTETMTQKPGCGGFGKGNFKDLFKSIEEYENKLNIN